MAHERKGPLSIVGRLLLALPFAGFGLFTVGSGVRTSTIPSIVFGLVFGGIGIGLIVSALRSHDTAESRAKRLAAGPVAVTSEAGPPMPYRHGAAPRTATARETYALALPTLPIHVLPFAVGRVLPISLRIEQSKNAWFLLGFSIVWSAVSGPSFIGMVATSQVLPALFLSLFVLVGLGIAFVAIRQILSRRKLARVEVGAEPTFGGDELTLYVEQPGPARINRITATLKCEERIRYTVGTTTKSEKHLVYSEELLDELSFTVRRGEPWSRSIRSTLPTGLYSFKAEHNEIVWSLVLKADIAGWPDYEEAFAFRVVPSVRPRAAA